MLRRHQDGILAYFDVRIDNGGASVKALAVRNPRAR
jgi:hypothetical protein